MNVLLLTDGIHPFVIGGMQKHSHNLAKHLTLSGIQLTLVHCVAKGSVVISHAETLTTLFGDATSVPNFNSFCFEFPKKSPFPGHYLTESYAYSKAIAESGKIKFDTFDIIYIQGFSGWYLLKKNIAARKKSIINFHGLEMFQKSTGFKGMITSLALKPFVKKNLRRSGYVQSLGGKLTQILANCGVNKKAIIQIPIGIDKSWLHENEINTGIKRKFIFIGRNERRKGFFELMQAFKEVQIKMPNAELHVIGPFENIERNNNLFFHGKITEESRIMEIIRSCDILICPSYAEGMPTVILEGMASGCAIIASDVGAVTEEVNASNGWLIEPGNVQSLVNKMLLALSESEETLTKMKIASVSKVKERFLWEHIVELTTRHFTQIKNLQT